MCHRFYFTQNQVNNVEINLKLVKNVINDFMQRSQLKFSVFCEPKLTHSPKYSQVDQVDQLLEKANIRDIINCKKAEYDLGHYQYYRVCKQRAYILKTLWSSLWSILAEKSNDINGEKFSIAAVPRSFSLCYLNVLSKVVKAPEHLRLKNTNQTETN